MNMHQEQHHASHHQDHSNEQTQTEMCDIAAGDSNEHESVLDELEKTMFARAR